MGELGQVTSTVGADRCLHRRYGGRVPCMKSPAFGWQEVLVGGLAGEWRNPYRGTGSCSATRNWRDTASRRAASKSASSISAISRSRSCSTCRPATEATLRIRCAGSDSVATREEQSRERRGQPVATTERRWPRRRPEQLLGEERIAVRPAVNRVEQFVRRGMAEDRLELRRLLGAVEPRQIQPLHGILSSNSANHGRSGWRRWSSSERKVATRRSRSSRRFRTRNASRSRVERSAQWTSSTTRTTGCRWPRRPGGRGRPRTSAPGATRAGGLKLAAVATLARSRGGGGRERPSSVRRGRPQRALRQRSGAARGGPRRSDRRAAGVAEIDRPALEHQSAGGTRGSSRLGHEPTLADTGFAREQHERGSTPGGRSERCGQPIELGLAADELRAGEATRHLHDHRFPVKRTTDRPAAMVVTGRSGANHVWPPTGLRSGRTVAAEEVTASLDLLRSPRRPGSSNQRTNRSGRSGRHTRGRLPTCRPETGIRSNRRRRTLCRGPGSSPTQARSAPPHLGKDGEPRPVRIGVDDGVAARRRVRRWRRRGRSWGRRWRRQRGRSWVGVGVGVAAGAGPLGVPVGDALTLARRMKASGPAELAPRSPMAIACDWRVSSVHSVLRSAVVDPQFGLRARGRGRSRGIVVGGQPASWQLDVHPTRLG